MPIQLAIGWGFPNALMQYSVPALESVSIDMAELTRKRDRLYGALSERGVHAHSPGRARSTCGAGRPAATPRLTATRWPSERVYLMPGTVFDRPEHFRISLTATAETIERALPDLVAAARID